MGVPGESDHTLLVIVVSKQPTMRIEDRLFDRGWVRSAMATRKCGNIYLRKYFMAVRKFTNIFVLLLILMVCVCVCVFFPFILDFNGRTSRGHTGRR